MNPVNIGICTCEVCGANGELILRSGKHFKYWYCKCPNGHLPEVKEETIDFFQIGDRVRLYHAPFDINKGIDFSTYIEGEVIAKEKWPINYSLDIRVEKAMFKGKPITKKSHIYGSTYRGIASDDQGLVLLTKQMRLTI